jgi:hypothetical protein
MKPKPVPTLFASWLDRWMVTPATLRRILLILSLLGLPSRNFAQRAEPEPGGGASVVGLEDESPSPITPPNRRPTDPEGLSTSNLSDLVLKLEYPKLAVPENRAYIALLFTINLPDRGPDGGPVGSTSFSGTNDIKVRATFVGGSATPGKDFDISEPVRFVPAEGGFGSANWVQLPLIQDEENEGTETAIFDLSIDGSTNAPVRMEVSIVDDLTIGEVGFVSPRFQINEGSTNGYVQLRMWRTLNSRNAATISYRLQGSADALAVLGGLTNRTATFQPGDSQIFIRIPLINNTEAQGTQDITFTIESSDDGMKVMNGLESTVLTLADDETLPSPSALTIREHSNETGERGAQLSAQVPRGYQVRLEYSDNGVDGPWQLFWILEGADTERQVFDTFDASVMRMFRILPPEPLDMTFPW